MMSIPTGRAAAGPQVKPTKTYRGEDPVNLDDRLMLSPPLLFLPLRTAGSLAHAQKKLSPSGIDYGAKLMPKPVFAETKDCPLLTPTE